MRGTSLPPRIRDFGILKRFVKVADLFRAGAAAAGFYNVLKGRLSIYKLDGQGRELEVARLEAGDFLGEAVAFIGGTFPFFARAVEDVEVRYFDVKSAFKAIDADPTVARFFIDLLARKCALLSGRVESLGLQTVRQRLIQYLLFSCSGESRCVVELKVKKAELASLIGTVAETLSRTLGQLQKEGLIEVSGPSIRIEDCPRLRAEISL